MSAKKIIFDHDALDTVKLGVKQLADAVKITLGPRGRNVIIQKKFWFPYHNKGWRYRCKGNRTFRPYAEYWCTNGKIRCFKNQ